MILGSRIQIKLALAQSENDEKSYRVVANIGSTVDIIIDE
jgi:hypothetical protein